MAGDGVAEMRAVARYLAGADRRIVREASKVVKKGSQNIKRAAQRNLGRSHTNWYLAIAMSYDLEDGGLSSEIGPDLSISGLGLGREFGSSGTPPHPFMFPAGDEEEPKLHAAMEDAVARAFEL